MHSKNKKILLTGLPYFVHMMAETIFALPSWEVQVIDPSLISTRTKVFLNLVPMLLKSDIWYQIGGYAGRGRIYKIARFFKTPVVIHWVGTDVLNAIQYAKQNAHLIKMSKNIINWAGAPWLVDELKSIGIQSRFVPLPLPLVNHALSSSVSPLPNTFTVLSYIPDTRSQFYGYNYILRLAREFSDIQFFIVGGKSLHTTEKMSNVKYFGWVDNMGEMYNKSTLLIRMTQHDGYGGTVQEALSFGRYAIWTYPFIGAFQATDYFTLRSHVQSLLDLHNKGFLRLNKKGREYMKVYMNPMKLSAQIRTYITDILIKKENL